MAGLNLTTKIYNARGNDSGVELNSGEVNEVYDIITDNTELREQNQKMAEILQKTLLRMCVNATNELNDFLKDYAEL